MNFFSELDSFEIKKDKLILKLIPKKKGANRNKKNTKPSRPQSNFEVQVIAKCPSCAGEMTLPPGGIVSVRCPHCDLVFCADTSRITDGYAETHYA